MANFYETIRPVDIDQVETISSWLNYRICRILLYTSSLTEVSQQFRSHLNSFGKNYRGLNKWKHYRWLAEPLAGERDGHSNGQKEKKSRQKRKHVERIIERNHQVN